MVSRFFRMLRPEQYALYYEFMKEFEAQGVTFHGRAKYGKEIYKYKDAFLSISPFYIHDGFWTLDIFMTLVEQNTTNGSLFSVCSESAEYGEEIDVKGDVKELLEEVQKNIDDPPDYMTTPYSDDDYDEDDLVKIGDRKSEDDVEE